MAKSSKFRRFQNRVEQLAEKYSEQPLVRPYLPRLSQLPCPPPAWSKFFRLKDSLCHAHTATEELRVFAVEPSSGKSSGRREYVVSSYEEFWYYYSKMKTAEKHFYEVIEEGAACHLYFDLEFPKKPNPELDGDELTAQLAKFVCQKIDRTFGIKCSKNHVLELDSTNELKFSRHLIYHLPGAVFRCNYDVGNFVKKMLEETGNRFLVNTDNGEELSIVDTGVYTKNRNFRLFQSCKKGKKTILTRSELCQFDLSYKNPRLSCCIHHAPKDLETPLKKRKSCGPSFDELTFFASLVTNVRYQDSLKILTFSAPEKLPRILTPSKTISSDSKGNYSKNSPFPTLQSFILSLTKFDENAAFVTKWVYFPCNHTVIYSIGGTRYCSNIGRQHKSNHIYFVADLSSNCCYQMCHDPVCKSQAYRSPTVPFPKHVCDDVLDRDCDVDDDELVDFVESLDGRKREFRDENENEWGNVSDSELISAANGLDV